MITHSILPQHRAEVAQLIDELDEIIDGVKSTLHEIDIEIPEILKNLTTILSDWLKHLHLLQKKLVPAARAYFKGGLFTVREKLLKVYYFES